ncbi:protein NATD1 [Centruroides vittatus]|uniref:protein NATD1 n=1 Tax=Centruroides vittatus TaxID=120091 RepID=UPI00350FFD39
MKIGYVVFIYFHYEINDDTESQSLLLIINIMSMIASIVGSRIISKIRKPHERFSNSQKQQQQQQQQQQWFCCQAENNVHHDAKNNEFYLKKGNDKATLKYKMLSPNVMELEHTTVPEAFRGQGIGRILAEAALQYVIKQNLQMKITCEYIQGFVKKYPNNEYTKRMV